MQLVIASTFFSKIDVFLSLSLLNKFPNTNQINKQGIIMKRDLRQKQNKTKLFKHFKKEKS